MAEPTSAGAVRAAIRVLPGLCDEVRQVARFIAVEGGDVDVGPRRGAVRMDGSGMCEIVAPASGVLISLPYGEVDTVTSEAVLAEIQTDR